MNLRTFLRTGTLALAIGALLLSNRARSEDYEFPTTPEAVKPKAKAAASSKSGAYQPKDKSMSKGPDFLFPETSPELSNENLLQCDEKLTNHIKLSRRLKDEGKSALSNTTRSPGAKERIECYADKDDLGSRLSVAEFQLRQGKDGAKTWQASMVCGDVFTNAAAKAIFKLFVAATEMQDHKKDLEAIKPKEKAWLCAQHFEDNTTLISLTWNPSKSEKKNFQRKAETTVYYSDRGYETFRLYDVTDSQLVMEGPGEQGGEDLILNRDLVFNKSALIKLTDSRYVKDNPLSTPPETTGKMVLALGLKSGAALGFQSNAIDGNVLDREIKILKPGRDETGRPGLIAVLPRAVSVDQKSNNPLGWFKEMNIESIEDGKITSTNLATTKLGQFLIKLDKIATTQLGKNAIWTELQLKSNSDALLRELSSHMDH